MRFGLPYMAILLWILPAMILFYVIVGRARGRALKRFAESSILPEIAGSCDPGRRKLKNWLVIIAVFLFVLVLMRPQWGFTWREAKRHGIDIIIALDTSKSMLAEDVRPNRLERSKLAIKDLVRRLKGDRIGLIAFSGTAFLQCPLTIDYDGFLLALNDIDVNTIPVGGTSLANAIYTAAKSYEEGKTQQKILIIITDGEDLEGGVDQAVAKARHENIRIFCVGIGAEGGELIPILDEKGKKAFLKDKEGNIVKTKLQEDTLQKIALETGGIYVQATGAEFGLDLIYDEELSKLEKEELKSRMEKKYHERYQFFLGFAILLLFIEPFIGDRKKENL